MIGPYDNVIGNWSVAEIVYLLLAVWLISLVVYRRIKYKWLDWFSLVLALILLAPYPLFCLLKWWLNER